MANAKQTKTITTLDTFDAADIGYLAYAGKKIGLSFTITTLPTTLEVGFLTQADDFIAFTDGGITETKTLIVSSVPPARVC